MAGLERRTIPVTSSVNPSLREGLAGDRELMLNETPCRARKKLDTVRRGGRPHKVVKIPGEAGGVGEPGSREHIRGIAEYMLS